MVLYCLKTGDIIKEKKYKNVRGNDAFDVNPHSGRPTNASNRNNGYSRFDEDEEEANVQADAVSSVPAS